MKILHVFPEMGMGGTEKVILQISRLMMEKADAIIGMCSSGGVKREEFEQAGIKLFDVPKFKEKQYIFSNFKYLYTTFVKFQPDIIHSHSLYALLLAFLVKHMIGMKFRIVHTGHGGPRKNYNKYAKYMAWMANKYIALSDNAFNEIKSVVGEKSTVLIPNGVDLPPFEEVYNSKSYNQDSKQVLNLGFVGRLTKAKGLSVLIKAIQQLNHKGIDTTLDIIGDGELRVNLEKDVKEKGLYEKVHFLGYQHNPWRLLKNRAVVVMPSLWENSPLVAFEAIVRNHTLVTSDLKVFQDVLEDGKEGYYFKTGDAKDLEKILSSIYKGDLLPLSITQEQQKRFVFEYSAGPKIRQLYEGLI